MRKNRMIWGLVCLIILSTFLSCNKEQKNTKAYLEMVNSPSTTLDNVWYNPGGIFRCAVFEGLLMPNADMTELKEALAKEYRASEDGLTYTFTLRNDVTWHDGEAFTAEDVIFSLKMLLRSEEVNGLLSAAFQYIEGAEAYSDGSSEELPGVVAEGNQVTVHLTAPIGNFLTAVAQFAILPEHILKGVDPALLSQDAYWKKPVGCGCYQVTTGAEDGYYILEAYEDYYGEQPGVEKIRLRLEEEDPVAAMENNRLDFYVTNDPEEVAKMKGLENCSEHRLNILFPAYFIFNLNEDSEVHASLQDVRVRKALLLAIDRDSIVEAVFPGSTVTDTLVPSWDNWYLADGEKYTFDPEEAKKLLEEAEFDFSRPIRLRYSTKGQSTLDLMNAVAVYWRAIGIQVDLQKFEGSGSEHMFQIRDFDVCYKRLSAFDHASIYEEVHGDGIMQTTLLNQPVYDTLIDELEYTAEEEKRAELIRQMQLLDQQYLLRLPLFALANVAYVNTEDFKMPEAYGNLWFRYDLCFEDWRLVAK